MCGTRRGGRSWRPGRRWAPEAAAEGRAAADGPPVPGHRALARWAGAVAFGTLFLDRLESLGVPEAYTFADALLACVYAAGRDSRAGGLCPDWYEGVADRIAPAVAESNGRKGARPDGRE